MVHTNKFMMKFVCRQCAECTFNGKLIQHNIALCDEQCDICGCKQGRSAPVLAYHFADQDIERIKNVLNASR